MAQRALTPEEVAAMWLFADEYSLQRLGAAEYFAALPRDRRVVISDFVRKMREAIRIQDANA